jgi:hypothetical protein
MLIIPNSDNEPDLLGYEMKKETTNHTTFIDKTPSIISLEGNKIKKRDSKNKERFWNMYQQQNSKDVRIGGWKLDKLG